MALPFLNNGSKKGRDQVIAVDLGGRTTKAVHVQRKGNDFVLTRYAILDAPIYEKTLSADLLSEHLKSVSAALEAKTKLVVLALGVNDAIVRHVEMPHMPVDDMRMVLKISPRNYLQQDLPNHVFDCHIIPPRQAAKPAEAAKATLGAPQKFRVLATGAKQQLVNDYQTAARNAGLVADVIFPGLIGPVNAFELALPQVFAKEAVALVDIGFRSTSISILNEGELIMSRVVAIGGDRLTSGLAESMGISYAEAEGIKVGMASEVQSTLESMLSPLGRELRASIDFFEHQHDRTITQAYLSGGTARSEFILATLQNEMMVECKTWDPTGFLQRELPPAQVAELEHVATQFGVALGAALAAI